MNTPATARPMMNPSRVMPFCLRLIVPFPFVQAAPGRRPCCLASADPLANAREIHAAVDVHPDQECPPTQALLRQVAPVSAVLAVVAVVAHHEIVTRRNRPLALAGIAERHAG